MPFRCYSPAPARPAVRPEPRPASPGREAACLSRMRPPTCTPRSLYLDLMHTGGVRRPSVSAEGLPGPQAKTFRFGPFSIDTGDKLLLREGRVVRLGPQVIGTLLVLLESSPRVVSKERFQELLYGDVHVELENALAKNVSLLRAAGLREYITNRPKLGYQWTGPLSIAA